MVRRAATLRDIDRMLGPPLELDGPSMRKSRRSNRARGDNRSGWQAV
jgi:hypothetical protein